MKKLFSLIVLAALVVGAAGVAQPWFVASAIEEAIRQGDEEALARHVDFPTLRENLKGRVGAAVAEATGGEEAGAIGRLLGGLAGGIAGTMVDAFVTPENLAAMARREGEESPFAGAEHGYEGLNRFAVTVRGEGEDGRPGEPQLVLVLERQGVHWRMTDVRMPDRDDDGS